MYSQKGNAAVAATVRAAVAGWRAGEPTDEVAATFGLGMREVSREHREVTDTAVREALHEGLASSGMPTGVRQYLVEAAVRAAVEEQDGRGA